MNFRDLLVHLDSSPRAAERLGLAIALARAHGARLTGLFAESCSLGPSLVARRDPQNIARAARESKALFEARTDGAEVATRWWQLEGDGGGDYAHVVGRTVLCCRYADLAVFGQQRGDEALVPDSLVEQVIADAGRPVLVVPSIGHYAELGRRVVIAWSGSREAARALNDALPLLQRAEKVTVLSLQLPSEGASHGGFPPVNVVEHLRAHGIEATYERTVVGDLDVVDQVLNRACDEGADLTVMGAYGLRGGAGVKRSETTRALLETMTTPALLSC